MSIAVSLLGAFPAPGEFIYDPDRPTYYTEYYAYCLHSHQAALAAAGAVAHIETATPEQQAIAVSELTTNISGWLSSVLDAYAAYQSGTSAAPPALPDAPALPEMIQSLALLLPGGKIALALKVALPFISKFLEMKEKIRETDPARVLAKALLKSNWWDPTNLTQKSWLEEINDNILNLQDALAGNDEKGVATVLRQALLRESDDGDSYTNVLDSLRQFFVTEDCTGNEMTLSQVVKIALMRCKDDDGTFETLQDSVDSLRDALSTISIFIETEKATRIRMGCIEGDEQPAQ